MNTETDQNDKHECTTTVDEIASGLVNYNIATIMMMN